MGMNKLRTQCLIRFLILVIILLNLIPTIQISAFDANKIQVTPSSVEQIVSSGSHQTYTITVSNGFDLAIEVGGLGETISGAPISVTAEDDSTPFSARSWVSVDKSQLGAGDNQILTITVNVPSGTPAGEKYAAIFLHSQPGEQGNAAIISGIVIPLIITVDKNSFVSNISGEITDLKVPNPYRGKALDILTYFSNTGNIRITNAKNKVTIKDSSDNIKWQNETPVASPSVIPSYPRIIDARYNVGLDLGNYSVTSEITLANGTIYSKTLSFTIIEAPPAPPAPVLISPGNITVPGPVINTLTTTFLWNEVSGADYYELSVSRDPYSTNDIIYNSDRITGTSFTLPAGSLFTGEKYRWQLTATNSMGTSDPSFLYFQTSGAPSNQPVITPAKSSTVTPIKPVNSGPLGVSWTLAGGIVGGLLIIGLLMVFLLTRRPSKKDQTGQRRK
jgi:hypothetical protein